MNIYEIIALIAEPDATTRFESIQRLASDALLPKPGAPLPRVTDFEITPVAVGGGYTNLKINDGSKILIDNGIVYEIYNKFPKAPTIKEVKQAVTFTKQPNGIFHLRTSNDDTVVIPEKMVVEMCHMLPQPAPIPPVSNPATVKQPDYEALITMLDNLVSYESSPDKVREEYQKWVEKNM